MAYQFWNLTREAIVEMKKLENKTMVFSNYDPNQTEDESRLTYKDKTKWNDFNVGVPILFNFYHGLELFMKGLLQEVGKLTPTQKNHKITEILSRIKENESLFTSEIIDLLEYYIGTNNPFHLFFEANEGNVDDFYIFLRYPESRNSENDYTFKEICGNEKPGLKRFVQIRKGCNDLKCSIINWKKNVA
ncbi:hypothetical protein [Maribacter sp. HTCC2170]|uniref:hypothetical protein n=1 Tax=Maribacter sp. (strain HTCC2170 / KCCM 42371) TaxID=313603 RepID=UPI0011D21C9F|nr:hypothetical protein [Maribacter sp. HTCC2170]